MHYYKTTSYVYVLAVTLFSAIYILPSIRILFDYVTLALVTFLFYGLFVFKYENITPIKTLVKNILPYMLLYFLIARFGDFKMGFLHPLLTAWCMLFPGILCQNVINRNNINEAKIIALLTMSMLVYVVYNTIDAFSVSPDVMRELTAGTLDETVQLQYMLSNVGGFGVAYGSGAIVVLLATLLVNKQRDIKVKCITYILLAYFIYFVFNAQFTTLLFLTVFCTLLSLFFSDYGQQHKVQLISISIVSFLLIPVFLTFAASLYEGTTIGEKLLRFNNAIFGGGNVVEASGERSKSQLNTLKLFLDSPFWGSDVTYSTQNSSIYGSSHSTMLGVACATGIIGLISYYKTYWAIMKPIFKSYVGNGKQYIALVLYFFCFSFFNPSESTEACWIMFMVVPLLFNIAKTYNDSYGI